MNLTLPAPVKNGTLLVSRLILGSILIAHGWQKLTVWGMDQTVGSFAKMGVPLPGVSAWFTALVELLGGIAIVLGLFTPIAGALVAGAMAGAWLFVHRQGGVFVADGGWELVGSIAAAALALIGSGAGAYSLDAVLQRTRAASAEVLTDDSANLDAGRAALAREAAAR